ncbi:hypothetical protein OEB99_06555 [Actinotalea sp. M2MS4P-6]|uniref:hypothetical protein n=1 Tax=Actinotalea sp. M2MS4P-6 TaxID=2983762 RepID=UPI0021E4BEE6|nr:hypothetical protein [Actinotalea sp. M2MS4P-6]MCV2393961.1 hypothetical protein [Actinotalea sp. M2MS4P-6]
MPASAGEPPDLEVDVTIALFAAVESEAAGTAVLSPVGFGLVAGGILLGLLALTYAFRNAGNKH